MPGPLNSIIAAVNSYLPQSVSTGIGANALQMEGAPPRVIWLPANESFGPPMGQGGDGISTPPPIWTRLANVEVHLWGADLDSTESLMSQFVQALQATVVGAYSLQGGQWVSQQSADVAGLAYVLTVQFLIPITRVAETVAIWNNAPTTAEIDFPDGTTYSVPVTQ